MLSRQLKDDFWWVGNQDPDLRVFDIVMHTGYGTTYNSYILKGTEKTVLFEAAKARFFDEYIAKITEITPLSGIDILVVNHTEPDHTGTIERMLDMHPGLRIVGTTGAMNFLKEVTNKAFDGQAVKDGEEIAIGGRTLRFIAAPNLHWPDTMFTYIPEDGIMVTCDAFGAHYAYAGVVDDEGCDKGVHLETARYYFDNILGPFKPDVLRALDRIEGLPISLIATGHGPVLANRPLEMVRLYREWAKAPERPETPMVAIPYVSAYGYTKALAETIAEGLREAGQEDGRGIDAGLYDMVYADLGDVVFRICEADGFLLGTPTVVGEALPPIWQVATSLNAKAVSGKAAGAFGSYGWSGEGVPHIMERLRQLKADIVEDGPRCRFKPDAAALDAAREYGRKFGRHVLAKRA